MKRKGKIFALVVSAVAAVAACGALTACGKLQADGPEYEYKMAPSDKAPYEFTGNVTSTVVPDAEITIETNPGTLTADRREVRRRLLRRTQVVQGKKDRRKRNGHARNDNVFCGNGDRRCGADRG